MRKPLEGSYRALKLVTCEQGFTSYIVAGATITMLHVLLDALLYDDIKPLYSLNKNSLYNQALVPLIFDVLVYHLREASARK